MLTYTSAEQSNGPGFCFADLRAQLYPALNYLFILMLKGVTFFFFGVWGKYTQQL